VAEVATAETVVTLILFMETPLELEVEEVGRFTVQRLISEEPEIKLLTPPF
jgi:hypothetical protein